MAISGSECLRLLLRGSGCWDAVAAFPGEKRFRCHGDARNRGTGVVDWPGRKLAEEFHHLYSFSPDCRSFIVALSVRCAAVDSDECRDSVLSNSTFLSFDWGI